MLLQINFQQLQYVTACKFPFEKIIFRETNCAILALPLHDLNQAHVSVCSAFEVSWMASGR